MTYTYKATITNVVDGDTIDAVVDLGFKIHTTQRLRLAHVNTPERNEPRFKEAAAFTAAQCLNKTVTITTSKPSKFGYYLADVLLPDGRYLATALIDAELGMPYEGGKK
jgi:micrococcal nuclease